MNILITGSAGFIGSHLAEHYAHSHRVIGIDNFITGAHRNIAHLDSRFQLITHDVCTFDFSSLPTIDIVFHLASPASPVQYKKHPVETLRVNSEGTYRILEAMRTGTIKKMVLASTSEVYGDPLVHPQVESYWGNVNPVGNRACYDEAKRYAEAMTMTYVHAYSVSARIARIFNTYGPRMEKNDGRVVSNFITQSLSNKDITVNGDGTQTRSFCYVTDLVRGLVALAETPSIDGEIINLGNPHEQTISELAHLVLSMIPSSSSQIRNTRIEQDDPKKRKPDITKAERILQWKPQIEIEAGLQKTIEYFQSLDL